MRRFFLILGTFVGALACNDRADIQCELNSNCDLSGGGVCTSAETGHRWCAYPDPNCPTGYRYSTQAVGDGVSGVCVAETDSGIDAGINDGGLPPPAAPSCVGLPMTCGPIGNDNCCNSPLVIGGMYYRSYDLAMDSDSGSTSYPATVSNFRLDKYEVSVGRFRAFIEAGMGTQSSPPVVGSGAHMNILGSGWDAAWNSSLTVDKAALIAAVKIARSGAGVNPLATWTDAPAVNESRPMNNISWYEAMAFCVWDGGYLPTEAEWNYAAAGGDQQRAYPWSSPDAASLAIDGAHASYYDGTNCIGDGIAGCSLTDLIMVGIKPRGDGRWGQSDLSGNVGEWTLDLYQSPYPNPCTDCADLTTGNTRVLRGGGFYASARGLRMNFRLVFAPTGRTEDEGFRCARAP
jgi:formylglycine-generating enzyme